MRLANGGDSASDNDPLEALKTTMDYETDLSFPQFVLKWHADRGMHGTVLDLGRQCPPDVLASYLEEDPRVESYRWIQDVRTGRNDAAAEKLLRLANGGANGKGMELGPAASSNGNKRSLDDRKVALNLGKLSDSLSKKTRTDEGGAGSRRKKALDDGLLLVQVQETVRSATGGTADPADVDEPLNAFQLVRLAVESVPEGGQIDDEDVRDARVNCLLAGLAAAETLDDRNSRGELAATVWEAAVRDDAERWAELGGISSGNDGTLAVGDMTAEERRAMTGGTVFGLLAGRYEEGRRREIGKGGGSTVTAAANAAAKVGGVGFVGNSYVRNRVVESLMEGSSSSEGGGDNGRGLAEALALAAAEA
uniref:Uncharacterized protein n=1 Tax=Odontella aurita TaxID=265563 RepID=A0A7S4MXU3_9STRA